MASQTWVVYDIETQRKGTVIPRVAASVKLTGVSVTNGSAAAQCASTAGLWPGMLLVGKGIPTGTTVLTVDDDTHFTLSANVTAALSANVVVAKSYIPYKADGTIATAEVHKEHFRNRVNGSSTMGLLATDGPTTYGVGPYTTGDGVSIYPNEDLEVTVGEGTGGNKTPILHATMKVALDDNVTGTAPRAQVEMCSFVHFILDDGALLPVRRTVNTDIVPLS